MTDKPKLTEFIASSGVTYKAAALREATAKLADKYDAAAQGWLTDAFPDHVSRDLIKAHSEETKTFAASVRSMDAVAFRSLCVRQELNYYLCGETPALLGPPPRRMT